MSAAAYPEVSAAWDACRYVKDHVPWPAVGGIEVHRHWRLLHDLTAPYANGEAAGEPPLAAIRTAREDLASKIRRYCGENAAEYVSGTGEATEEGEIGDAA